MDSFIAVGIALVVLVGLAWMLYRPKVQQSSKYQATVVPLANIMDVGFIVLGPAIILLAGYTAPFFMLGICLVAMAVGFAISYNIRYYEPIEGTDDPINRIGFLSRWALTGASIINIAYYTLLLITLLLWPLGMYNDMNLAVVGTALLVVLIVVGMAGGMGWLNRLGDKTTAFNISAVIAVVVAFVIYNIQDALGGRWEIPLNDPNMSGEDFRKILGLFAIVQGFEASRYIGSRFSGELRITTMRVAQVIASVVFVAFLASALILFVEVDTDFSGTAIFVVSEEVGALMPWLILVAAIGSEASAIINATMSRSDMLASNKVRMPRKWTFVFLLVPAIAVFLLADIPSAVSMASRVFAAYYLLQAVIAWILARRARNWWAVAGFTAIAVVMAIVTIFGLSL